MTPPKIRIVASEPPPQPATVEVRAVPAEPEVEPPAAAPPPAPSPPPAREKPVPAPVLLPQPVRPTAETPSWLERLGLAKKKPRVADAMLERALLAAVSRSERLRPAFSGTWIAPDLPADARVLAEYTIQGCRVRVCRLAGSTEGLYHLSPEEYALSDEELRLLLAARDALANTIPDSIELTNLSQTREYVMRRTSVLLADLQGRLADRLSGSPGEVREKLERLARILTRYSAGYGALEHLLTDPKVSDIYINAPAGSTPVRVTLHSKGDLPQKCRTNVNLAKVDEEALLSRLRYESGRPFSEAYPVMDADVSLFSARAAVIGPPLSPDGIAVALRRHSLAPWTLARLMDVGAINALTAGLLSTLIQAQCTLIIAGGRGAGKTSLLSALLFEIPVGNRILTVEDTQEIPVPALQENGYQVQSLTVRSAVGAGNASELTADDALKVAMRLGESAIVMGEVRGQEARTLYESMRAGTAGSTVLGTFHGDSALSVYERAVHDMGIPAASFAATDAVVIAGLVRRGASTHFNRRLVQIAEFDKAHPESGTFHDLVNYDVGKQDWVVTDHMQRSSGLISRIGSKWGLNYFDTTRVIETRATVLAHVVRRSHELDRPELLSAATAPRVNGVLQERLDAQPLPGADYDAIMEAAIADVDERVIGA